MYNIHLQLDLNSPFHVEAPNLKKTSQSTAVQFKDRRRETLGFLANKFEKLRLNSLSSSSYVEEILEEYLGGQLRVNNYFLDFDNSSRNTNKELDYKGDEWTIFLNC